MVGVEDLGGCVGAHVVAVVAAPMVEAQQLVPRQATLVVSRPLLECLEIFSFADGAEGASGHSVLFSTKRSSVVTTGLGSASSATACLILLIPLSKSSSDIAARVESARTPTLRA